MRTNSYILNSKFGRRLLLALLFFLAFQVATSLAIRFVVSRYTTANRYMDNKESRFLHIERHADSGLDYIFVGSSFTKNHLSSQMFSDRGLRVFNFGIPGRLLGDLPSMVDKALAKKPKTILIGLSASDFYKPVSTEFPTQADLSAFLASKQPLSVIVPSFWYAILNLSALHYYREAIYVKLTALLSRLDWHSTASASSSVPFASPTIDRSQLLEKPDCEAFKSTDYGGAVMRLVNCTNGDGIEYGLIEPLQGAKKELKLGEINPGSMRLLTYVLQTIKDRGVRAIVFLKPVWGLNIQYDAQELSSRIQAPVLDFTHEEYPRELWGDEDHLNYYGRKVFTEMIIGKLQKLP